jgi:hypothetical protein
MQAVVDEMHGLRFNMVWVAYVVRVQNLNVTNEFLDRILPVVEAYQGPDRDEKAIRNLKESRQLADVERAALHEKVRKPDVHKTVPQYALPLFVTQLADLAICPLWFQRGVLNVRFHLDLFNQLAGQMETWNEKLFGENLADRGVLKNNIHHRFRDLGERAEIIINAINTLKP